MRANCQLVPSWLGVHFSHLCLSWKASGLTAYAVPGQLAQPQYERLTPVLTTSSCPGPTTYRLQGQSCPSYTACVASHTNDLLLCANVTAIWVHQDGRSAAEHVTSKWQASKQHIHQCMHRITICKVQDCRTQSTKQHAERI